MSSLVRLTALVAALGVIGVIGWLYSQGLLQWFAGLGSNPNVELHQCLVDEGEKIPPYFADAIYDPIKKCYGYRYSIPRELRPHTYVAYYPRREAVRMEFPDDHPAYREFARIFGRPPPHAVTIRPTNFNYDVSSKVKLGIEKGWMVPSPLDERFVEDASVKGEDGYYSVVYYPRDTNFPFYLLCVGREAPKNGDWTAMICRGGGRVCNGLEVTHSLVGDNAAQMQAADAVLQQLLGQFVESCQE